MKSYRDIDGDSGSEAFEYGEDRIRMQFKRGRTYEYTASSFGVTHHNRMKQLAE